jgi:capsular polysaccharide transport system ATP-binding protein
MIELERVTKTYPTPRGPKLVLDSVSATFPLRTSVGILGRNGAGKSTLMRIIGGAELPDDGIVHRPARVSWPIGFSGGVAGSLTGEQNSRFLANLYGADPDGVAEFASTFADIGSYFHMPVKTYSSGMRARLAFALSMALDFDYYLVDEVIGTGDTRFQERSRNALRERRDRAAVILVSHQLQVVREWCELYAVLDRGELEFFDDFERAKRTYERASA